MSKIVYVIRGVSGCGKSKLAMELAPPTHICCADDYHMVDGVYCWKAENQHLAHLQCFKRFYSLTEHGYGPVVVANTNTTEKEIKKYLDRAYEQGYEVISIVVENRHGNKDVHGVPEEVLVRQEENIRKSLKLR